MLLALTLLPLSFPSSRARGILSSVEPILRISTPTFSEHRGNPGGGHRPISRFQGELKKCTPRIVRRPWCCDVSASEERGRQSKRTYIRGRHETALRGERALWCYRWARRRGDSRCGRGDRASYRRGGIEEGSMAVSGNDVAAAWC